MMASLPVWKKKSKVAKQMAFLGKQKINIEFGDIGIAYINPNDMKAFKLSPGGTIHNRHGKFNHDSMVGKKWGSKVASAANSGFMYILHPTPELWTLALSHRTQILYMPDISFVSQMLELRPGANMIEAGTGSGSFSHSIARTIAPTGNLYTFEYHKERQIQAQQEFKEHGLVNVHSFHRDVCKDGFDVDVHQDLVTAVFLDMPSPWECIDRPSFKGVFKKKRIGRICCFSPCVEQVQLTCKSLKNNGFTNIKMFEVLMREHSIKQVQLFNLPTSKDEPTAKKRKRMVDTAGASDAPDSGEVSVLTSCIMPKVRGHTSFLTFATLFPEDSS